MCTCVCVCVCVWGVQLRVCLCGLRTAEVGVDVERERDSKYQQTIILRQFALGGWLASQPFQESEGLECGRENLYGARFQDFGRKSCWPSVQSLAEVPRRTRQRFQAKSADKSTNESRKPQKSTPSISTTNSARKFKRKSTMEHVEQPNCL